MERKSSFVRFIQNGMWGFIDGKKLGLDKDIYFSNSSIIDGSLIKLNDTLEFSLSNNSRGYVAKDILLVERFQSKFNTEDKGKWTQEGYEMEETFINEIAPKIGKNNLIEHPMKEHFDWYIDFFDNDTQGIADLKCQRTPFFTCNKVDSRYIPQYTVTFNKNDYEKYIKQYPKYTSQDNFTIYWWVDWEKLYYPKADIRINHLSGVWAVQFSKIADDIHSNVVPLHEYKNRKGDRINAKDSYLFDLRSFDQLL